MEYFETYQLTPKYIVGDQAFMGLEMESFYNRLNIRPISLGPGTPWPNRAEAAVCMYKKQVTLMLKTIAEDPALGDITYRQLLRQASLAKNSIVYSRWCYSIRDSIRTTTCRYSLAGSNDTCSADY